MNIDFYYKLIESARDSIIVVDKSEQITFWNKAAQDEFGYSKNEAIGKKLHQLIIPTRYHNAHKDFSRHDGTMYQNKPIHYSEVTAIRKDGSEFPVEVSLSSIMISGEWCVVGFVRNISLRKKRDEQIRKLSGAVEQSPSTVVITDTQGGIEYCNPKFTQLSGYSLEEIQGKNPRILKSGFHPDSVYIDLWTTITVGLEWRSELLNRKKSGEVYWEYASISPLRNAEGVITHYLKVAEEITDRKRAERDLLEAKKAAEKASEAKTEFLANMSHEIRTPMNVIIGMTDHILEEEISEGHREYLSMVNDSAKLLLSIINQILDFSKVEAGMLELKSEPFNLKEIIERLVKIQAVAAMEKKIDIRLEFQEEIPNAVLGDPVRLQQVLINLVGNAIKFTDHGEVVVSVALKERRQSSIEIVVSIKDTGIGIPEEKLHRLFKSFSQIDSSLARQYDGTGLGLAISKKLVELMGGSIDVNSELERGSTFYFTCQLELNTNKEHNVVEQNSTQKGELSTSIKEDLRILLVEDKHMNQVLARTILEKKGWIVNVADNGIMSLDLLQRNSYDIILMDIQMPEMDGIQVTEIIRKLKGNPNQNVPIIAMTANTMTGDREKYLQHGMDDYIGKPFQSKELYEVIEKNRKQKQSEIPEGLVQAYIGMGHDLDLYKELVEIFLEDTIYDIEKLEQAIQEVKYYDIVRIAHGIKGELGNIGAKRAYELAATLEQLGRNKNFEGMRTNFQLFTQEMQKLKEFFGTEDWHGRF